MGVTRSWHLPYVATQGNGDSGNANKKQTAILPGIGDESCWILPCPPSPLTDPSTPGAMLGPLRATLEAELGTAFAETQDGACAGSVADFCHS